MTTESRDVKMYKLFQSGMTKAAIARQFKVDESSVRRAIKRVEKNNGATNASATVDAKAKLKAKAKAVAPKAEKPAIEHVVTPVVKAIAKTVREAIEQGSKPAYVITGDSIVLTFGEDMELIEKTHPAFAKIRAAILDEDFKTAIDNMNVGKAITNFTKGSITIKNGEMFYGEMQMKSSLVTRILELAQKGDEGFKTLVNFFERLQKNPSKQAVQELWGFVSHLDVEILEDGRLVGWKKVNRKYDGGLYDCRTGKVPNDVGNLVEMPRYMVNDNSAETCSQGLHVGAWGYMQHFSGNTHLKVIVDPADVVSIPADYNDMKMRAAKYFVEAEVNLDRKVIVEAKDAQDPRHIMVGQYGEILSNEPFVG